MGTFDDKAMIDRMIAGNGWLPECGDHDTPDNPPAVRIVEYTTPEGATTWGVVFRGERDPGRYERPTYYVQNPRVIWRKKDV
jgi:hypothetical protein